LNAALQGQGTVISAQQILCLAELTDIARDEPKAGAFLTSEGWEASTFRSALADTKFLRVFTTYLEDYGHRGVGESDIMSPRLAENPEAILAILRTQFASDSPSPTTILARQEKTKVAALAQIKERLGWRFDKQVIFFMVLPKTLSLLRPARGESTSFDVLLNCDPYPSVTTWRTPGYTGLP
jgi:pyruvate,water dikinase